VRQRGWLYFVIPAGFWLEEFSCDSVEWTSRSRRLALRLEAITGGLGKASLQLAVVCWREVYLLTIEDILGNAGLKDVTKGVRSFLADFCSCD